MKWWEKKKEAPTIWQACKTPEGLDYFFNTETNETTWEKPDELMTDEEKDAAGDWQWVPDKELCFIPGKKLEEIPGKGKSKVQLEDGTQITVATKKLIPLKKSTLQRRVNDLVLLDQMSPPLILHQLKMRFEENKIYTNVGTILISLNPYEWLDLYNRQIIEKYIFRGTDEMPPHVFNIAHDSFIGLREYKINQAIIISGESGAGKTEATKQCLNYIAVIAGSIGNVQKQLLQANPILEAFGNAKTIRNDNSSRFGKYMEMFFNKDMKIFGATITNYLLEKIRVVSQAEGERNFHIFYQLTKSASPAMKKKFQLEDSTQYKILMGGNCHEVSGINDDKEFAELMGAFQSLQFPSKDIDSMFTIVAGILALGNLEFTTKGNKAVVKNAKWEKRVADALKIPPEILKKALAYRELRIRGQKATQVGLSVDEAQSCALTLGKFIYGLMFDWIVKKINSVMGIPKSAEQSVGILDIFGFEIFKHNSFEQLCINFTNEMLQQHFNNQTFKLEEKVYKSEGIKFDHVKFIDNQPMIELIRKKPIGILPLLDEELVVPKGTDKTFIGKLENKQRSNKVFKKYLKNPNYFVIRHYAGEVVYDSHGFLDKNRDTLTQDLLECVQQSTLPLMQTLFPKKAVSSKDKKMSLSRQFQKQLDQLMRKLNQTEPHYIRCVKPNDTKSPLKFTPKNCMQQLTYSGVYEAVSIRKQGFPFRLPHKGFIDRYNCIFGDPSFSSTKEGCKTIIKKLKFSNENVQMGKTMVLYRAEEHKKLELDRSLKVMTKLIGEKLDKLVRENTSGYNKEKKDEYFSRLAMGVRQADEFRLKSGSAEKARKLLDEYIEARMDKGTKRKLEASLKSKIKEDLEEALAQSDENGYRTSLTRACRAMLEKVMDAEAALGISIDGVCEEDLIRSLEMCDEFKYDSPSVETARKLLEDIKYCNSMLDKGKTELDHEKLEEGLASAGEINLQTQSVNEARGLYNRIMECRTKLQMALKKVQRIELESALAVADGFGYESLLVQDCRTLLARVERIEEVANDASQTLDEDMVRTVAAAANEIGMTNEFIEYYNGLVNGKYDYFLAEQYKKAKEIGDHNRAIRLFIARKDILVKENEHNLTLTRYNKLKMPEIWAKQKWFGNKEKIAARMLKWSKDTVHSPLLAPVNINDKKRSKDVVKASKNAHKTILIYCGFKKAKKLEKLLAQLVTDAIRLEEIRAEVYIQVMKTCTEIPPEAQSKNPNGVTRAIELMAFLLSFVPPPLDFEDFMENWIRQSQFENLCEKWKMKGLLRRIVYNGQKPPPGETTCVDLSSYLVADNRQRGFTEPAPSNTYDDLKDPYDGGGGGGQYGGGGGGGQYGGDQYGTVQESEPVRGGGGGESPAPQSESVWRPIFDEESGDTYFYNEETGESLWEPPEGE